MPLGRITGDVYKRQPIDFWQQTLPALRKEYPGIYLLAEGEAPALHDGAFDASYAWELHHLLNDIAQGRKSAADLRAYVARDSAAMPREAFRLMFTSNHDENSWAGPEFERMGDAARVMALLTFTLPNGQPLVYTCLLYTSLHVEDVLDEIASDAVLQRPFELVPEREFEQRRQPPVIGCRLVPVSYTHLKPLFLKRTRGKGFFEGAVWAPA